MHGRGAGRNPPLSHFPVLLRSNHICQSNHICPGDELTLAVDAAEASRLANRRELLAATLAELFPETLHRF